VLFAQAPLLGCGGRAEDECTEQAGQESASSDQEDGVREHGLLKS
jgi:hypothetical protein